jgi:hypothetical protein
VSREVTLNRYCQVVLETNRYSVPAQLATKQLTLRAYPFKVEIWDGATLLATHARSYEREADILNPLHYLSLLAQRPGAFDHAAPLQEWRSTWPALYETLLQHLRRQQPGPQAVRQFIAVLQLHETHPAGQVVAAIEEALAHNIPHLEGITFCLHKLRDNAPCLPAVDTTHQPRLAAVGTPPVPASHYNQLLQQVHA